jgi:hypothetical protein
MRFQYDDNAGDEDKLFILESDSGRYEWTIHGTVGDFNAVSQHIKNGKDYITAGASSSLPVYWVLEHGSLWILHGDRDSWDFGLNLKPYDVTLLLEVLEAGPK